MKTSLSREEARRIALGAQGFAERRPAGRVDRRHLRKVMNRLELLQLDSVPVVIRTQYMPLFSRLGAYRPELLDEVAYASDEWFEAWSHEASLLPVESEPLLRWSKESARRGATWKHLYRLAKKEPAYVDSVLAEVKARGRLAPSELSDPGPRTSSGWGSRSAGSVALDWLHRIGEVGVRRRSGFAKEFDLFERIIPKEIRAKPTPSLEEALDALLLRSAKAYGIGNADCLVDYFRLPKRPAKARLEGLVESGRLLQCEVEGWTQSGYLDPAAKSPRKIEGAALLSPFDPVVWNRKRIEGLFDFEYRIEIYTPAEKRRWGYYVMPFLMDGRLVGRFDLKTDRERGCLCVPAAHFETATASARGSASASTSTSTSACAPAPAEIAEAAAIELEGLARLVGADRIEVGRRGNGAKALRAAVAGRG
ncbi:MAG: winged helix-turn-helix domain-containing protein [Myxococcota bacterium]